MNMEMTPDQIIAAINALTEVVKANKGLFGSESTAFEANQKIQELIKQLKT
jgi:hypothetical protein